jgi:peptide/nickel transport system permease protein
MPSFWFGLILLIVFFYYLGLFPSSGRLGFIQSPPPHVTGFYTIDSLLSGQFDIFKAALVHMVLPAFTLSIGAIAMLARLTRSGMLETLSKDYIRLATSIGLPQRTINYKLALKNTLIPTVTFLGLAVGSMLGGSIIIETVFSWPGLGHFAVTALLSKDLYAVLGVVLMMALVYSLFSLVVDLLYGILDPRIRYG